MSWKRLIVLTLAASLSAPAASLAQQRTQPRQSHAQAGGALPQIKFTEYRLKNGLIDKKYLAPHTHQRVWLIKEHPELIEGLRVAAARRRGQGRQEQEH